MQKCPDIFRASPQTSDSKDVDDFLEEFEEETVEKKRKVPEERTSRKRFCNSTPLKEPSSAEEEDAELLNSSHSSISSTEDMDEDEEIEGVAMFNARKYSRIQKKREIQENGNCGIDYGKAYIGHVIICGKEFLKIKFLERKPNDTYDRLKRDDVDDSVDVKYVFHGPIKLVGTTPYQIRGVNVAYKNYIKI
ncbi:hypothetical protein E2C01_014182 [Portunus trituberculatus]|uniref:Uncharacterized protein n=1 Tax=Portunus trituberculatus TaxID=210409 RepID=A0A5B7DJ85_PORTR|nr:hypothetical protein [Portunus trituberculatus]